MKKDGYRKKAERQKKRYRFTHLLKHLYSIFVQQNSHAHNYHCISHEHKMNDTTILNIHTQLHTYTDIYIAKRRSIYTHIFNQVRV